MSKSAVRVLVGGRVQGVGFRATTRQVAARLELAGSAVNLPDGRVQIYAEGDRSSCEQLVAWLSGTDTPGAVAVADVSVEWVPATGAAGFTVR